MAETGEDNVPFELRSALRRAMQMEQDHSAWEPDPSAPDGGQGPGHHLRFSWSRARDQAWNDFQDAVPGWGIYRNWHRYGQVRTALSHAGVQASHLMVVETGDMIKLILSGLLPSLVEIAKWVGLGAVIGGAIGALGGPADEVTVPGGALAGARLGLWVANSLGLAELLVGVLSNLGTFVEYAAAATEVAWYAGDDPHIPRESDLVRASTLYAYAIAELWMAVLTALVAEVLKRAAEYGGKQLGRIDPKALTRGLQEVSDKIGESKLGRGTAAWFRDNFARIQQAVEKHKEQIRKLAARGDSGSGNDEQAPSQGQNNQPAGTQSQQPSTAGQYRDRNGRLRNADGTFASEPRSGAIRYSRSTEYPHGNDPAIRQQIVQANTDPVTGQVIDPETGQPIPPDQVTIEHTQSVVDHWNQEGYNESRAERNSWYNDPSNLTVMPRGANSSAGATLGQTYRQTVGPNYTP